MPNMSGRGAPFIGATADIADAIMFLPRPPRRANLSQMLIGAFDDAKPF